MGPTLRVADAVVLREQVHEHVRLVALALPGMSAVVTLLLVALWPVADHGLLVAWGGSLLAPFVFRAWLASDYRRRPDGRSLEAWRRWFRASFLAHGLAWALAAAVLVGTLDVTDQVLLTCAMAGVIATSLNTAVFDRTAGLFVLVPAAASWSARMLAEGGRVHIALGAMLALFLTYMAIYAVRIHRSYRSGVLLRDAAATRADALARFQTAWTRMWQQAEQGDPDELLRMVTREVATALHVDRARVFRLDAETDQAVLVAAAGPEGLVDEATAPVPLGRIPAYLAALAETGRLSSDGTRSTPAWADSHGTALGATPGTARLDLPLGGIRPTGVLTCERAAGPWSADEEAFATSAAATLQAAAEEARRRDAERQLRDLNQNLEEVVASRTSALQHSEARLAQALEATNDGLWDLELPARTIYGSPVLARLLGYGPGELPTTTEFFRGIVHPDDLAHLQAGVARHIAGAQARVELELRLRTKSGDYRWFMVQGKVVQRDAAGRPARMLGTVGDITARKRALEDLHESEERFRALFAKSPIIVTLIDLAESRVAEMNEVGLRTFGYTRDEMIGRTTLELGLWVDEPERRRAARRLIDAGLVSALELQLRRKDGRPFWALLNSIVVTFQGQPFALTTLQDITEHRELESRVRQSQKMEVVGHLAGGVAHDFNNVLTIITSTAELAMSGTRDGDPMYDALQTIRDASTRAARLTGQLLAFSRQQILQPAPLDLNDVVGALGPMVRRVAGDAVVLHVQLAPAPVAVVADRGSLEQVLLNLAINARDAMPDGGALTVAVGTAQLAGGEGSTTLAPGAYAAVSVADTGTGMTDATRQRIFEPFFTTKDAGRGTGLGLAMVHGVVHQSGGDIVVESTPGAGSRFTIYLPISNETPIATTTTRQTVTVGSERVLIVDDDPGVREVLRRALSYAGYAVVLAGSGEEALTQLEAVGGRVDLVVTDVMMPGIGGAELAERVRVRYPSARILFTSGYAENAIAHHGVLADGVQFIAKPYSLQALTRKVRDVLDR